VGQRLSKTARGRLLEAVAFVSVLILCAQLLHLQVVSHDHYLQMSEENRIRVTPIPAVRGRIFDREDRLLVSDRPSYTVSIVPSEAKDLESLADKLSPLLDTPSADIIQKVRERRFRKYEPVKVKRDVDFRTVCIIEEAADLYPGVIYQLDHARFYHYNGLACHLLGYTGEVGETEGNDTYRIGSTIGKSGLEKEYDRILRGFEGVEYLEVAATGRILGPLQERPGREPVAGTDMILSVDLDLQEQADSLFGDTLTGAAVFIDPRSGEVLALVSKPTYDANLFSGLVPRDEYQELLQDSRRPLFDRAVSGTYPPGSTAKVFSAGAALQEGIVTADTRFSPCFGGYQFGRRYFHCWSPSGHGSLDLVGAIEQSCDTYFYQLGLKLGLDRWHEEAVACGFASPSGIDLPTEKTGTVPDEKWYNRVYGEKGWTRAILLNLSIGQGEFLTTPLSLAEFYCGLADSGRVMKPHLVKAWREQDGTVTPVKPVILRELPFSPKVIETLREGCLQVVEGDRGTARGSRIPGIPSAGKTGTAQNPHGNEHSWFVGYAPADQPEIVGCVIVENAGHGSTVAAPFVQKVFMRYFEKTGALKRGLADNESGGSPDAR
jgi:penicillin-binding protein 2